MSLSVDKALRKAKKHMMAGEPTEAEELYKKVLSRFPKNRKAILGYQKLKAGITSQGASSSELPQEKVQELVDLYKQGQFDKVLAKVKHLTGLYPEAFIFHFLQGGSNAALQRYKAATQSYKNAVRIKPESFEANFNLGNALKGNGDLEAAISSFKEALKIKPDHVDTHLNLGNTFKDKGKLEAAVHSYQQVLKIKFDYAEAHLNMGNALKDWGKLEAAMHSYKQALKINSDFSEAYLNMGATLMEKGEPDRARELYKKAIKIKPSYAMAYWNLSGTAASVTEAVTLVEKCLQLNNNHTLAKFTLAFLNFLKVTKNNYIIYLIRHLRSMRLLDHFLGFCRYLKCPNYTSADGNYLMLSLRRPTVRDHFMNMEFGEVMPSVI